MGCGKKEVQEDGTLMGRLATRMVARDFIDKQNLGMGTKAQKAATAAAPKAPQAKLETGKDEVPTRLNISGPANMESKEHSLPVEKGKKIAKDHLKKDTDYYKKLNDSGL